MPIKSCLLIVAFFLLGAQGMAQRPTLTDEDEVAQTVIAEIDEVFKSPDFTRKKEKRFKEVSGTVTVDIGVIRNGKVSTFFNAGTDIRDIDFINFMSDYILDHKFRFKLKKNQRYKIRHTLNF